MQRPRRRRLVAHGRAAGRARRAEGGDINQLLTDPCPVCRFDSSEYTDTDLKRSLGAVAVRRDWMLEGVPHAVLADDRVRALINASRDPAGELPAAVHAAQHALHELAGVLRELGAGAVTQTGTVEAVFASDGGVPKRPIEEARIGYRGVDGDRQATRVHHGRVWQALCLWSADVIDRLRAEGHPIAPGNAGENISIRGLDWRTMRPGVQLALGDGVVAEVSSYAPPCSNNAGWFIDGDFGRIDLEREPGISRVYASVLQDGVVRLGDTVTVEPSTKP